MELGEQAVVAIAISLPVVLLAAYLGAGNPTGSSSNPARASTCTPSSGDERIEMVIAKTVAGFLNTEGGALLIGVNDHGDVVGLVNDFAVVKSPDRDRFELWLRDFLGGTLGMNAAALPLIDFEAVTVDGADTFVCRVTCPSSPRPVFVRPAKGAGPSELWVRTGNSTRQLKVDEAVDYVMLRWPLGIGRTVAAQLRAAVRGSGAA